MYPEFGHALLQSLEYQARARMAPGVYGARGGILGWVGGVIKDIGNFFGGGGGKVAGGILCALVPPSCAVVGTLLATSHALNAIRGRGPDPPDTTRQSGWATSRTPEGGWVAWPAGETLSAAAAQHRAIYWTPGLPGWMDAALLPHALE